MTQILINHEWNNFPSYFNKAYRIIDIDRDIPDVTLACDDGALDAHQFILCAASLFFRRLLKKHKPDLHFIYMKGLKMKQLQSLMDFIYHGQVSLATDNVETFINTAVEFGIKGIHDVRNTAKDKEDVEVSKNAKVLGKPLHARAQSEKEVDAVVDIKDQDIAGQRTNHVYNIMNEIADVKEENTNMEDNDSIAKSESNTIELASEQLKEELQEEFMEEIDPITVNFVNGEEEKMKSDKNYTIEKPKTAMPVDKIKGENSIINLGMTFASLAEVKEAIITLSDTTLCKFVNYANARKSKSSKIRMMYKCTFGVLRKSQSKGIRQQTQKYVGCPAFVEFVHSPHGLFRVARGNLEHENHEVSEESYLKMKRRLSKDQEEAVKVILDTEPTTAELAMFLSNITGKQYNSDNARYIRAKFTRRQ